MGQNGSVFMSVEVLTIIIAAASLFVALGGGLFAGFAWMLRRMDERFDKVDDKFEKVYKEFDKVREEMSELRADLTEVKISVARLEGPSPRLIWPK